MFIVDAALFTDVRTTTPAFTLNIPSEANHTEQPPAGLGARLQEAGVSILPRRGRPTSTLEKKVGGQAR